MHDQFPKEIHQHTELFLDDDVILNNTLPLHRPSVDTKIRFNKNNQGQERENSMRTAVRNFHDQLLILIKTLMGFLVKKVASS